MPQRDFSSPRELTRVPGARPTATRSFASASDTRDVARCGRPVCRDPIRSADLDAEDALQDHDDGEESEERAEDQQRELTPGRRLDLARQKLSIHVPYLDAVD